MNFHKINTIVLIVIASSWLYMEIQDQGHRAAQEARQNRAYLEFKRFHEAGPCFSAKDGKLLLEIMEKLK